MTTPADVPRRRPRRLAAALPALLAAACSPGEPPAWPEVLADVRARFPAVPQVPIDGLRERLDAVPAERPRLLDARSRPEHARSHLAGAHHAPDLAAALAALGGTADEREILVYCSVGVRSSALAEELRARGFTGAANLEGGIFAWANAGLPTVRTAADGTEVPEPLVHPYDARWGALLDAGRRAPLE